MKKVVEIESDEYEEQWMARTWHKDGWLAGVMCDTPGEAVESLLAIHFGVQAKEEEFPY